ncbi:MAG: glycosyltransferase family 2 protein, partial [Actinomycetota bacterium]|nr:glycosyltransferase family 2 protein [Actinomycetota bacterium]
LCARRASWTATGSPTRLGDRPDIAILVEEVSDDLGEPVFPADVRLLVGEELEVYAAAVASAAFRPSRAPAVSCLMPTYNRRRFAERAIGFFLEQDYANRELVIVDDGQDAVDDLVPDGAPIRYHRLDARATIGRKRELACQLAEGELLVQWDDDDWYGPARLRRQVAPLVAGTAEIAGILRGYLLDLKTFRFWRGQPPLHEGDVHALIVAGTLAYTRDAWGETGGYPDRSIGEEVALLQAVLDAGGRVAPIVSDGIYICVRHGANSWRLRFNADQGPPGWAAVPPPEFLTAADLGFYRSLSQAAAA